MIEKASPGNSDSTEYHISVIRAIAFNDLPAEERIFTGWKAPGKLGWRRLLAVFARQLPPGRAVAGLGVLSSLLLGGKLDQLIANVRDVFFHGALGSLAIPRLERPSNSAVRSHCVIGRQIVSLAATNPGEALNILEDRNERGAAGGFSDRAVKIHVFLAVFEFFIFI